MAAETHPDERAYHELQCYTLAHGDAAFIHQHVVDAWAAQHADEGSKPIGVAFALIGLYLQLEKGFSGRQVQLAHMALARRERSWPGFALPADRGAVTAVDVMAAPPGPSRDAAIVAWCRSVWGALRDHHDAVADLVRQFGIA